jgi:hypothetical protein
MRRRNARGESRSLRLLPRNGCEFRLHFSQRPLKRGSQVYLKSVAGKRSLNILLAIFETKFPSLLIGTLRTSDLKMNLNGLSSKRVTRVSMASARSGRGVKLYKYGPLS